MSAQLFVKICGITRVKDGEMASGLGADALGFVFWPGSPRYVAPEVARRITERVPPHVMKVGVFVDEPVEQVVRVFERAGLTAAQLHGHESPEYCRELSVRLPPDAATVGSGFSWTVIKAVGVTDDTAADASAFGSDVLLLVDTHDP
jgi:phosphoribosylanthranilate isomerase